jgi:BolA family transcriptional regulator, general stress-responsive regulator
MNGGTYRVRIERKLTQVFSPVALEIRDDSQLHVGHAGQNLLGETHFSIRIVSPVFAGMSAVARQRETLPTSCESVCLQVLSVGSWHRT